MKNGIFIIGAVFAVALAYFVGSRLSAEALAVVVGSICGLSASIPLCLALVIASSNNWGRREEPIEPDYRYDPRRYAPQPPIMFVAPPQTPVPYGYSSNPYLMPTPTPNVTLESREFKIIGGE